MLSFYTYHLQHFNLFCYSIYNEQPWLRMTNDYAKTLNVIMKLQRKYAHIDVIPTRQAPVSYCIAVTFIIFQKYVLSFNTIVIYKTIAYSVYRLRKWQVARGMRRTMFCFSIQQSSLFLREGTEMLPKLNFDTRRRMC